MLRAWPYDFIRSRSIRGRLCHRSRHRYSKDLHMDSFDPAAVTVRSGHFIGGE
jgi:hypothetical protein